MMVGSAEAGSCRGRDLYVENLVSDREVTTEGQKMNVYVYVNMTKDLTLFLL